MAIRIIGYQPVRFRTTQEMEADDCQCQGQCFCQLVNQNDPTTWQMNSDNEVLNGTFDTDLEDWVIGQSLTVSVAITNESIEGECDGQLVITASGGTGPYTYSVDGISFQSSNTFPMLCDGCYNVVVKDSLDNLGFATACIDTNVDCGDYTSPDLFDLATIDISKLLNCYLFDLE